MQLFENVKKPSYSQGFSETWIEKKHIKEGAALTIIIHYETRKARKILKNVNYAEVKC